MDFDESSEDAAFRAEVCAWLARPDVIGEVRRFNGLTPDDDLDWVAVAKVWQQFLADEGWACITWPREYGGRGGSSTQAAIFAEEAARVGAFGATFAVGISMAGPTIIAHGSDEQKQRFLPTMLRGDEIWCQLFSEPGAGSDLAGLSTRAVRDGDEWIVDGQKVWTSGAHFSDWGILLARTDIDQPKHRGITYFLLDMRTPGIEVRPLRQITGTAHFNEVFLSGVRIPNANVLGEVNGGWGVAMTTLANERTFMGGHSRALGYRDLIALARDRGLATDPVIRQGLAASFTRAELARYTNLRVRTVTSRGLPPGPEVSVAKLAAGWNLKRNTELALSIVGAAGTLMSADAPLHGQWQLAFLGAPAIRIAGGSDEIQRNVIGERVLGLPAEPRVDKVLPFRDLPTGVAAVSRRATSDVFDVDELTDDQLERRRRVIDAAFELGAERGYDAVQMRDVAATANVALATIYRYFSSKDHLLVAAMTEWTARLQGRVAQSPPRGDTAADQLVDVLHRACHAMQRQPKLSMALVRALSSADSGVQESSLEVRQQIGSMGEKILVDLPPNVRTDILDVLGHVWYSTLVAWANGRNEFSYVTTELERATRALVEPHCAPRPM